MTNQGKVPPGRGAGAAVQGAIDTSGRAPSAPLEETIRRRAYQLYREREGRAGDAIGDWLAAERELRDHLETRVQSTPQAVGHGRTQ
jgi:hypothetical protein